MIPAYLLCQPLTYLEQRGYSAKDFTPEQIEEERRMMTEVIAKNKAGKVNMDELLGPGENPDSADAVDLLNALEGMVYMHKLMMKKTNHGASFYDAECIRSMNVAPMIASQVIARVRAKMEGTVKQ